MIVKRTKPFWKMEDGDWKATNSVAVHYVKKLADAPAGAVEYLTANKAEACEVTPEQFEAVVAYHAGRRFAGKFEAVGAADTGRDLGKVVAAEINRVVEGAKAPAAPKG